MKKIIFALSTLALLSCSKEGVTPLNEENTSLEETTQTRRFEQNNDVNSEFVAFSTPLKAGQNTTVGTVDVDYNGTDLIITYNITEPNWTMVDTHLWVGTCGQQPMNNAGNPQIGHFPIKDTFDPGVTSKSYNVAWDEVAAAEGCIAAHAVVVNTSNGEEETAWGEGDPYSNNANSWAMIFGFNVR